MKKIMLKSPQGYEIPLWDQSGGAERLLIICHGFASSKDSPMVEALRDTMPRHGIGTLSFDFPAHGESQAGDWRLRVSNCLQDLAAVEAYALKEQPRAEILYFGSSFGAYLTLLYLAQYPHKGERAFLRSAAVTMGDIFSSWIKGTPPQWLEDEHGPFFHMDYEDGRRMAVYRAFLDDLKEQDVFAHYPREGAALFLAHGVQDETAPYEAARRFAQKAGATLFSFPHGEHRLMGEGELEGVLEAALGFFAT